MIAVDTSALMAILLDEPEAADCADTLASSHPVLVSAAPVAKALIDGLTHQGLNAVNARKAW